MANLRVVYNNVADRASSLAASTTSGSLAASNLLTDYKTEVWRSTGTTATLTLTWAASVPVSMVALAFTNLSSVATMRVQCYTNSGDSSPALDTLDTLCCPVNLGFTAPLGFGGGVYADNWFPQTSVQKIVVTVIDAGSTSGYIQAARLVTGTYWSPDRNAETESVKLTMQEDTKNTRSEAGTLWTDRAPMYKKLQFDLSYMTQADRNAIWRIIAGNGMSGSLYVSMMPDSTDVWEEQIYSIYGRLSSSTSLTYRYLHLHATQLQLEEV